MTPYVRAKFRVMFRHFETTSILMRCNGGRSLDILDSYKEIDQLHIKFCKYILGVRQQTSNYVVYE